LASDTLIGVVRAWAMACHQHPPPTRHPAGHPGRPAVVATPSGPGPRLHPGRVPRLGAGRLPGPPGRWRTPAPHPRKATKTARFLDLVTER